MKEEVGRLADQPQEIPVAGWREIIWRTLVTMGAKNLSVAAAGIAFFAFLSLFPALGFIASVYGLLAEPEDVRNLLWQIRDMLPETTRVALEEQLGRLLGASGEIVGFSLAVSLVIGFWSTTAAMRAAMLALNIAYREDEKRSFLRFHQQSLILSAMSVVFVIFVFSLLAFLPVLLRFLGMKDSVEFILLIFRWPILTVIAILFLSIFYAYGPSRNEPRWSWVSWGLSSPRQFGFVCRDCFPFMPRIWPITVRRSAPWALLLVS